MTVALTSTTNEALAAAIKDLQAQITTLKRNSMLLGPEQQGPRPGEASNLTLRASRILPPNFTGPYMELDLTQVPTNNTTRLSPALHVNDGTVERVQLGNLGPNGVSPAQYGLRVNDASGNPIFDSLGLIAVMTQVGGTIQNVNQIATATYVVLTGSSTTFSVTRSGTYGVWFSAHTSYSGTGLGTGVVDLFLDGVDNDTVNSLPLWFAGVSIASTASGFAAPLTLGPGSHTVDLRTLQNGNVGTSVFTVITYQITVFRMGS